MRIYSYVVARDFGFAPNPFYGFCTLATCKPVIRRVAAVGDWVVGTGSARQKHQGRLVYAMKISEVLTFDDYWSDTRFTEKKPNLHGSVKQAFGDNIYHRTGGESSWRQADSHHSLSTGAINIENMKDDTQTNRVLISTEFVYYGGEGPKVPHDLRSFNGYDICAAGRNHKSIFPAELVAAFANWFRSLNEHGYLGAPLDWQTNH